MVSPETNAPGRRIAVFVDQQPDDRLSSWEVRENRRYTDVCDQTIGLPRRGLAIVFRSSADPSIVALGTYRRGRRVSNWSTNYTVTDIRWLDPTFLPLIDLLAELPAQTRGHYSVPLQSKGPLTVAGERAVLSALRRVDPSLEGMILQLTGYPDLTAALGRDRAILLAEEKDATGLALDLAGVPRDQFTDWTPQDVDAPFIAGMRQGYADEERILQFDAERFDGLLSRVHGRSPHLRVFNHPQAGMLIVGNFNQRPIERVLGLDLLYWHVRRQSYVLVQYKRMRRQRDGGWIYYGDQQLNAELARMRQLSIARTGRGVQEFRLNPHPCYLKIVREDLFDAASNELMKGMYLPLKLVDVLLTDSRFSTEGGNLCVGWDSSKRHEPPYLTTTDFTVLFRGGWVGSWGSTTDQITASINQALERGRMVTFALRDSGSAQLP
jgi:hypothetical protein